MDILFCKGDQKKSFIKKYLRPKKFCLLLFIHVFLINISDEKIMKNDLVSACFKCPSPHVSDYILFYNKVEFLAQAFQPCVLQIFSRKTFHFISAYGHTTKTNTARSKLFLFFVFKKLSFFHA